MLLSAASMNERMAADDTPCASGLLRGSDAPGAEADHTLGIMIGPLFPRPVPRLGARLKHAQAISAMTRRSFIFVPDTQRLAFSKDRCSEKNGSVFVCRRSAIRFRWSPS